MGKEQGVVTMRIHKTPARVAVVPKQWGYRLVISSLIAMAAVMVISPPQSRQLAESVRGWVVDATGQMLLWMTRPMERLEDVQISIAQWQNLKEEHAALTQEVKRLKKVEQQALVLVQENTRLKEILRVLPAAQVHQVTARLLGESRGGIWQHALLNAGRKQGVVTGQAVMNPDGLVGRIADVSEQSARVVFVTDVNSRIPVQAETSGLRGVLAGRHGQMPQLLYIAEDAALSTGERLMTSGDGGMLPAGLPVGVVAEREESGQIAVRPLVDWQRLDYVTVLQLQAPLQPEAAAVTAPSPQPAAGK